MLFEDFISIICFIVEDTFTQYIITQTKKNIDPTPGIQEYKKPNAVSHPKIVGYKIVLFANP